MPISPGLCSTPVQSANPFFASNCGFLNGPYHHKNALFPGVGFGMIIAYKIVALETRIMVYFGFLQHKMPFLPLFQILLIYYKFSRKATQRGNLQKKTKVCKVFTDNIIKS
ncbi:MAG: hypothetical protein PVI93_19990 [Desulfobacterales bacterium]